MIDINLNLPIDTAPTNGSTNLIDSNAVFDGLALKENNLPSIVGNSLKVLRVNAGETAKEWATISTGLTIGTTPITSGVAGRVLFEGAGNVAQEDSAFFWDNTNKRLGVGATPATNARLDVRAQGALSTDIAFRVRNSANTDNIIQVNGDNSLFLLGTDAGGLRLTRPTGHNLLIQHRPQGTLPSQLIFNSFATGGSIPQIIFDAAGAGGNFSFNISRFTFGLSTLTGSGIQSAFGGIASAGFFMKNSAGYDGSGTIPTATPIDHFIMYSADIVAGNAAPHFRTEDGSVIKLYKQNLPTNPTNAEIATLLSNLGLANLI